MVENLKTMTDDEVINVINKIVTDNVDVELSDLKLILAEASGRKLEKKYINIIAERIKSKIQPEPVEIKRKTEQITVRPVHESKEEPSKQVSEASKPTFDDVYNVSDFDEEDEETEKYPALSFISGLFKVFAWILLIGSIVGFGLFGFFYFKGVAYLICATVFIGIVTGLITFLYFLCLSEKIKIQIDIEKHLRDIKESVNK